MYTRAQQKEKRRQDIIETGLDLFVRNGYAATKISDIATHVGMSPGLLFHYFDSKEKLYEALINLGVSGPLSITPDSGEEPIAFFKRAAEKTLYAVRSEPFSAKMLILMSQAMYNEATTPEVKELLSKYDIITLSIPLIKAGQSNKTIKQGDPLALAVAYWSALQGIATAAALRPNSPCPNPDWILDILRAKP